MNWLLIIVLLLVIGSAGFGYYKGLVRILFSICALVISIAISSVLTPFITQWVNENTGIHDAVQAQCQQWIGNSSAAAGLSDTLTTVTSEAEVLEEQVQTILDQQDLPEMIKELIQENIVSMSSQAVSSGVAVETAIADSMADMVVSAVSFLVTMIVIRIVLWIVLSILNTMAMLPGIRGVNRIAGMVCGFVEGLLIVWVFFIFLTAILQTTFGQDCMRMIAESRILSMLYNHNLLTLFLY